MCSGVRITDKCNDATLVPIGIAMESAECVFPEKSPTDDTSACRGLVLLLVVN